MRSAELTLPGFVHDVCAGFHALGVGAPFFVDTPLAEHGLRFAHPEFPLAHPLDGGRAGVLMRSVADTVDRFDPSTARRYRRLLGPLVERWDDLSAMLLGPMLRLPHHPATMTRFGLTTARPATWLTRGMSDEAAGLLAGCAAHAFLPLTNPLTGSFGAMLAAAGHAVGWPVAVGGSQAIADAVESHLRQLGVEIRVGHRVSSLADLPAHRVALFDTDPHQLATIAGDALPARFGRRLRRFAAGPAAFKLDYALREPVPWTNADCRRAGTVHAGGAIDEIAAAERAVGRGQMPQRPFVLVGQQSLADPSRAPAGRHTLWVYGHVPAGYDGDATDAIEGQIERFAPGFHDVVLARHVTTPAGFERYNPNYRGGDIAGGAHSGMQMLMRPTWRSYRTPNPAVFLCSASTPPGAGVHGMCGVHAARAALRYLSDPR